MEAQAKAGGDLDQGCGMEMKRMKGIWGFTLWVEPIELAEILDVHAVRLSAHTLDC